MNEENYIIFLTISLLIGFIYFMINSYFAVSSPKLLPKKSYDLKKVTAIIPVYNEDPDLFEKVMQSVSGIKTIVVGDGCLEPYYSITKKYEGEFIYIKNRSGKRNALAQGLKKVKTEFVLFLDSDTILSEGSLTHMLSLMDEKTGGISPRVLMINNNKYSYYYSEFFERMSEVLQRALSRRGKVAVLYGHCALYRVDLIKKIVLSKNFTNPQVLGKRLTIGDDRQLTNFILNSGYRAIIDYGSTAFTMPPEDIKGFVNQVIRWTKSNYFYFISDVIHGTIFKKGTLYIFNSFYTNVLPLLFIVFLLLDFSHDPKSYMYELFEYPKILLYVIFRIMDFLASMPILINILYIHTSHSFHGTPIHLFYNGHKLHVKFLTTTIHILSSLSSLPFAFAMFKLVERDRLKIIILGSVALVVQFFAAFYALLTLWKQDSWGTR